MKIPKTLKIGGHTVKVVLVERVDEHDSDGSWDVDTNTIEISNKLPQSQKEATLIHEILHTLNATWGESHMSHSMLAGTAEQLYQVLADNHLLAR